MEKIFFRRPKVFGRESLFSGLIVKLSAPDAVGRSETGNAGLGADGEVSHVDIAADFIDGFLRISSVRMAVNHDAIPASPSQKVVHRSVQRFALDTPKGHIHSGDCRHGYGSAAPIRAPI